MSIYTFSVVLIVGCVGSFYYRKFLKYRTEESIRKAYID